MKETQNEFLDPDSIYDVQVKRLHEYKRQLLNVLHSMYIYNRLINEPDFNPPARTFIFGAQAASGYRRAKSLITLFTSVSEKFITNRGVRGGYQVFCE